MVKVGLKIDLNDKKARSLLNKIKKGAMVQIPKDVLQGTPNVFMDVRDDLASKMDKSMRMGRGVRCCMSPDESSSMTGEGMKFTQGGRVKSLKQLSRDAGKAFKKAGEELKRVPKYYRKNIREYTSPMAKVLIQDGIPMIGEKLVEEGLKAAGADPFTAKLAGKAAKAGLEKPAKMGYEQSGLGLRGLPGASRIAPERRIPKMPVRVLPGSTLKEPQDMGTGLYAGRAIGGRIPRSAGGALRYKDIYLSETMLPKITYGGNIVESGRLLATTHGAYTPYITASTPMMPLPSGKGLY